MPKERNLEKEVTELKAEVKRLGEQLDRKAWGNPHDFAYRALSEIELIRDYYGGGVGSAERLRDLVERLRATAAGRARSQHSGAAFIFGLADLIEGAYLENRYNVEVHAYAERMRITGKQPKQGRPEKETS